MTHRTLPQIFIAFFNRIVQNEWNGLPNHTRVKKYLQLLKEIF